MGIIAYTNNGNVVKHVGTKSIRPGETREVDESLLGIAAAQPVEPAPEPDPLLDILDGTVPEIVNGLTDLADEELVQLLDAEEAGKTRKSVVSAIREEQIARAAGVGDGE